MTLDIKIEKSKLVPKLVPDKPNEDLSFCVNREVRIKFNSEFKDIVIVFVTDEGISKEMDVLEPGSELILTLCSQVKINSNKL